MSRCRVSRLRCKRTQPRKDPSHVSRHDQGILIEEENTGTEEAGLNGSSRMELEGSGVTFCNIGLGGKSWTGAANQALRSILPHHLTKSMNDIYFKYSTSTMTPDLFIQPN
jgi:hypothetical protein